MSIGPCGSPYRTCGEEASHAPCYLHRPGRPRAIGRRRGVQPLHRRGGAPQLRHRRLRDRGVGPRLRGPEGVLRERPHRLPHGARAARARPRLRRGRRLQDAEAGGGRPAQERPARRRVHRPHARHPQHRRGPAARHGGRGRPGPRPRPRRRDPRAPPLEAAPQHVPDQAGPRLGRAQRRRGEEEGLDEGPLEVGVSVNLFFTSFAKQAHRSRKGGFTGCANAFSPIPVTA